MERPAPTRFLECLKTKAAKSTQDSEIKKEGEIKSAALNEAETEKERELRVRKTFKVDSF